MKAAEWIDRVKTTRGWETDYRVAKELGFSRNTIGTYRNGRSTTMDEDTAEKVALALNINPAAVLIDQLAERSKNPETRSILAKTAGELYIMLSCISYRIDSCSRIVQAAKSLISPSIPAF